MIFVAMIPIITCFRFWGKSDGKTLLWIFERKKRVIIFSGGYFTGVGGLGFAEINRPRNGSKYPSEGTLVEWPFWFLLERVVELF